MDIKTRILACHKECNAVEFVTNYNGYEVYLAYNSDHVLYTGFPILLKVKDDKITKPDEKEMWELINIIKNSDIIKRVPDKRGF